MSDQPVKTSSDHQPVRTRNHLANVVRFSPRQIMRAVGEVEDFNAKFAVIVTSGVGTMACAYVFALLALISLPAILIEANVLKRSDVPVRRRLSESRPARQQTTSAASRRRRRRWRGRLASGQIKSPGHMVACAMPRSRRIRKGVDQLIHQ
jgi:hypothetical protein